MAKRKNSTALFEVMRAAQQKALQRQDLSALVHSPAANGSAASAKPAERRQVDSKPIEPKPAKPVAAARSYAPPSGQSQFKPMGTPAIVTVTKRWLASLLEKKATAHHEVEVEASPDLDPADPTAGITARSLSSRASRSALTPPPSHPIVSRQPAVEQTSDRVWVEDVDEAEAPAAVAAQSARRHVQTAIAPSQSRPEVAGTQVAIDRDRQQVTVKVRFQTIIIGVVAALAVIGLAYIVGKQAGTPVAKVPTSKEIKTGKTQPGVLDPRGANDARTASDQTSGAMAQVSPSPNGSTIVRPGDAFFEDAPVANGAAKRSATLNYCVIAAYSAGQQQWAFDVRDYLNGAGIPCTIEVGRKNLHTNVGDYVLIGTRGFAPRFGNTPTHTQYLESIERAARAYPDKSKFSKPQPMMVRWVDE